jgi:hypothetical protein
MSVINTGHIDGSRRLMILWVVSEGVYVDTFSWGVGVMLIWLNQSEVSAITFGEAVMSVQLELSSGSWVITIVINVLGGEVAVVQIFVVSTVDVVVTSYNPYEFLLSLGKSATFIGIKEDVVNVQTGVSKGY